MKSLTRPYDQGSYSLALKREVNLTKSSAPSAEKTWDNLKENSPWEESALVNINISERVWNAKPWSFLTCLIGGTMSSVGMLASDLPLCFERCPFQDHCTSLLYTDSITSCEHANKLHLKLLSRFIDIYVNLLTCANLSMWTDLLTYANSAP